MIRGLSGLVGVRYALYDLYRNEDDGAGASHRDCPLPWRRLASRREASFRLMATAANSARWRPVAERDAASSRYAFAAYQYGDVDYPVFRTLGDFDGEVLLRSKRGLSPRATGKRS